MGAGGQWGFERNVVLLGLTSLLNDVSSEIIYPLLPAFLTTVLGGGPAIIGLIEGVAESTASLLKLVSGWVSDRTRRRKGLVVGGYALAAVARPLIALASAPWQVLVIRFGDRVGKGIRTAPRDALLAESSPQAAWGRSFGLHRAMDHLGAVIGPLLAFGLMSLLAGDYRAVFAVASIPGALAVAVVAFGVRERQHPVVAEATPIPVPLGQPVPAGLRRFLVVVFVFTLGNSTDAFLLLRAHDLGVMTAHLPLLWVVLHLVKSATSVPGGALSDRVGRRRVIIAGWGLYAAVYLGFAAAGTAAEAWGLFALYGLFFGLTEGTEKALVADLVGPSDRGVGFGLYHLTVGLAAFPASVVFGVVWYAYGPRVAFAIGAALAAAAALLLAGWLRAPQRRGGNDR
jgi:MFS family permease